MIHLLLGGRLSLKGAPHTRTGPERAYTRIYDIPARAANESFVKCPSSAASAAAAASVV